MTREQENLVKGYFEAILHYMESIVVITLEEMGVGVRIPFS